MANAINFDKQSLSLSNEYLSVELSYESGHSDGNELNSLEYHNFINLDNESGYAGSLAVKLNRNNKPPSLCLISGITGGVYLHTADDTDNCYSVKLMEDTLILSLGSKFLSIDLINVELNWCIQPDFASIFECYDLEGDFLFRGEMEIHRIDIHGNIKWSYGGRDIWVNIEGKEEVRILSDKILLTDFENNEYVIDFDGNTIT